MLEKRTLIIAAGAIALFLLYSIRDSLALLTFLFVPIAVLVGVGFLIGWFVTHRGAPSAPNTSVAASAPRPHVVASTTPLVGGLQSAFRRNQLPQLDQTLATLPQWPVSQQLRVTAHALHDLKRSIYRAQAEGVPASIIQRYLDNTTQAAESLWQLASKVDALGQQRIDYQLIAARLEQETRQLADLQRSAQAAQDGIALLLVSGIQSDTVRNVDEDLSALTRAMHELARH